MLEIHRAKTLNSGNRQIKFILHQGIVTHHRSHHFQALPRSTTLPNSTWHQAYNQAQVGQPKDISVMGHCGKNMTSPMVAMVDLKCSPLNNSQDRGRHLRAHLECLQHRLVTIQSIGRHRPPPLHTDKFLAHLGDLPLGSKETIPASCGTMQDRCGRDCGFAPITSNFFRWIRCLYWDRWFLGLGRGWRQGPNQLEANGIHLEAICQKDEAAQLWCLQQVEDSMSGWVSREEALVHYPGTEPVETDA